MNHHRTAIAPAPGAACRHRQHALTADLRSLSGTHMQELGLWPGAIAHVVTDLLARDGCACRAGDRPAPGKPCL